MITNSSTSTSEMSSKADEIRLRMYELRSEIDGDVEELVEGAKSLFDWRDYVRTYPLASIGVACAFGFMLVPKRNQTGEATARKLADMLRSEDLVITPENARKHSAWTGPLATTLASVVLRAAASFAGKHLATAMSSESQNSRTPSSTKSQAFPTDSQSANGDR